MAKTTLPTLYKLTSTGAIQEWKISTEDNVIITTHGQIDGKKQTAQITVSEGKNIGRSNATTPETQAASDAQSKWDQKRKNHYVLSETDARSGATDTSVIAGGTKPMLAHSYDKQASKITWPAKTQAKLDGHRCIATVEEDGSVKLWSRTQKPILSVPHIAEAIKLLQLEAGAVLDGELYNHELREDFQRLTSLLRKQEPAPGHEVIEYHIYDAPSLDLPFSDRQSFIETSVPNVAPLRVVATEDAMNEEEMFRTQQQLIADGYEGLMIRNSDSLYQNGRSYNLQKVKTFEDAEFTITAVEDGKGKMAERAIFVCTTENGKTFRCKMAGTLDSLSEIWTDRASYVGQTLTVKFQGRTDDNIPRFPIGMRLRKDM